MKLIFSSYALLKNLSVTTAALFCVYTHECPSITFVMYLPFFVENLCLTLDTICHVPSQSQSTTEAVILRFIFSLGSAVADILTYHTISKHIAGLTIVLSTPASSNFICSHHLYKRYKLRTLEIFEKTSRVSLAYCMSKAVDHIYLTTLGFSVDTSVENFLPFIKSRFVVEFLRGIALSTLLRYLEANNSRLAPVFRRLLRAGLLFGTRDIHVSRKRAKGVLLAIAANSDWHLLNSPELLRMLYKLQLEQPRTVLFKKLRDQYLFVKGRLGDFFCLWSIIELSHLLGVSYSVTLLIAVAAQTTLRRPSDWMFCILLTFLSSNLILMAFLISFEESVCESLRFCLRQTYVIPRLTINTVVTILIWQTSGMMCLEPTLSQVMPSVSLIALLGALSEYSFRHLTVIALFDCVVRALMHFKFQIDQIKVNSVDKEWSLPLSNAEEFLIANYVQEPELFELADDSVMDWQTL